MTETNAAYCRTASWPVPSPLSDGLNVTKQARRRPSAEPFLAVRTGETPMPIATPAADAAQSLVEEITNWRQVVPAVFAREFSAICEELFVALAGRSCVALVRLLTTEGLLDDVELSLAAEALGRAENRKLARQTLVQFLKHRSALVREGAIYGLAELGSSEVRLAIAVVAKKDTHPGVRRAAGAVLAGWDERAQG